MVLDTCLKRERKILSIAKREEAEGISNIKLAISSLEGYKKKYEAGYKDKTAGYMNDIEIGNLKLSGSDLIRFLINMIELLNLMGRDMGKIESRLEKEELFLKEGNRNPKYFNDFILAWDDEMKANEAMFKHLNRVIKRNKRVIINMDKEANRSSFRTFTTVGSLGVGAFGAVSSLRYNNQAAALGMVIGGAIAIAMAGFIISLMMQVKEELVDVKKDEQLLQHLEEIRKIKKPFWKKMFSS